MAVKIPAQKVTVNKGTPSEARVVQVRLELPEHVYDTYAHQSVARGGNVDPERVMSERLTKFKDSTERHTVHFTDEQKTRLDKLLGHTVSDAEGVLQRLTAAKVLDMGEVKLEIPMRVLQRLQTRVRRGQTLSEVVAKQALHGLELFTGLKFK